MIRVARPEDAAAILHIYAPYITGTVTSFEAEMPSHAEMQRRITDTLTTYPWLVYAPDEGVRGYAYAGSHRSRTAYQWSVDVSIYVGDGMQRRGVGRALYAALFGVLRGQGFYNAYAGATLPNPASVGLHEAVGFERVGVYREVGYKFGAWHDTLWMALALQPKAEQPAPPVPFAKFRHRPECALALAQGMQLLRA